MTRLDLMQKQSTQTYTLHLNQADEPSKDKHKSTKLTIDFVCQLFYQGIRKCSMCRARVLHEITSTTNRCVMCYVLCYNHTAEQKS